MSTQFGLFTFLIFTRGLNKLQNIFRNRIKLRKLILNGDVY